MNEMIVLFTSDPRQEPEKAFMALSIASAGQVSEIPVKLFCALDGVNLLRKGYLDGLDLPGMSPPAELLELFAEEGGTIFLCQPFLAPRGIEESELIKGVTLVSAPTLVFEAAKANVISL